MATIEVPDPAMSHGEVAEGALDEAYERMARTDFELPNGFINHGPMACEALAVLGQHDQLEAWARWFAETHGEGPEAVEPNGQRSFDWSGALGDYQRLPEWLGFYGRSPGQAGRIVSSRVRSDRGPALVRRRRAGDPMRRPSGGPSAERCGSGTSFCWLG